MQLNTQLRSLVKGGRRGFWDDFRRALLGSGGGHLNWRRRRASRPEVRRVAIGVMVLYSLSLRSVPSPRAPEGSARAGDFRPAGGGRQREEEVLGQKALCR